MFLKAGQSISHFSKISSSFAVCQSSTFSIFQKPPFSPPLIWEMALFRFVLFVAFCFLKAGYILLEFVLATPSVMKYSSKTLKDINGLIIVDLAQQKTPSIYQIPLNGFSDAVEQAAVHAHSEYIPLIFLLINWFHLLVFHKLVFCFSLKRRMSGLFVNI